MSGVSFLILLRIFINSLMSMGRVGPGVGMGLKGLFEPGTILKTEIRLTRFRGPPNVWFTCYWDMNIVEKVIA